MNTHPIPDIIAAPDGNFASAPGTTVYRAVHAVCDCLHNQNRTANLTFNDIKLTVRSGSHPQDVMEQYDLRCEIRRLERGG